MREMTLVREITVEIVPQDTVRIAKNSRVPITFRDGPFVPPDVEIEEVRGERFVTAGGKMVCIGFSSDVRDVIGLPCGIFERQQKEIGDLSSQLDDLRARQSKLQSLSLWQRIKVLFGADPMRFCV